MSKWDDDRYKEAYEVTMEGLPPHQTMDRLTSFLYVLMRDRLPPGVVTEVAIDAHVGEGPFILSNGYLAKYAEHLAHKLRGTDQILEELESSGVALPSAFRERLKDKRKGELHDVAGETESTEDVAESQPSRSEEKESGNADDSSSSQNATSASATDDSEDGSAK